MLHVRLIVILVVCLGAAAAEAQTSSNARRAFIDVPVGPDWDDAQMDSTRVRGATWRSGLSFGFDSGRSGVEFNVGVPQWHVKNPPPLRFRYVGQSFGWEQQGHSYESSSTVRRRSIDLTVMYRANLPIHRQVTFTWLVGGGFVYRPERVTSRAKEVLPDGQLVEVYANTSTSFRNYMAATTGLDVECRLAPHVSVVPRLRVTVFPSLLDDSGLTPRVFVARPELAVRWGW